MDKACPHLFLHFSPNYPALNMGGEVIELDPDTKNGCDRTSKDSFWVIGKLKYSDIQLLPPLDPEARKHYQSISRLHCTIRYEARYNMWSVLDGAIYLSEQDTHPGEEVVTASSNGVWIDNERVRVNDWCNIGNGTKLHFGNDKRILIYESSEPTLNDMIWEDDNWVCRGEKKVSDTPLAASEELLKHTKGNAGVPVSKPPESPWSILGRLADWFIRTPQSPSENFVKLFLIGVFVAFLFSDEFDILMKWFFNR